MDCSLPLSMCVGCRWYAGRGVKAMGKARAWHIVYFVANSQMVGQPVGKANVLNRTTNVRCYRYELIHIGEHLLYKAATGLVRLPVLGVDASPS